MIDIDSMVVDVALQNGRHFDQRTETGSAVPDQTVILMVDNAHVVLVCLIGQPFQDLELRIFGSGSVEVVSCKDSIMNQEIPILLRIESRQFFSNAFRLECRHGRKVFAMGGKLQAIVPGGNRRQDSVQAGLDACDLDTRYVLVHDGARPCITSAVISEVAKLVKRVPAVAVGRRMTDTVKRVEKGKSTAIVETVDRDTLWSVQTPQAFQMKVIRDAYRALGKNEVTDDCQAVELSGVQARIYETNQPNFKITTVEDLQIASALLK